MNITLFGGAFDPPHLGHQQVAKELLSGNSSKIVKEQSPSPSQPVTDQVWYVPVKNHHFRKEMTVSDHRVAMLELIQEPGTKIEMIEIDSPDDQVNYTADTLDKLTDQCPEHTFSWVIGSDNLANFHKWGRFPEMVENYTFYVYPRAEFPLEPLYEGMVPLVGMKEVAVSSTQVRQKVAKRESVTGLVDEKVKEYIEKNELYL